MRVWMLLAAFMLAAVAAHAQTIRWPANRVYIDTLSKTLEQSVVDGDLSGGGIAPRQSTNCATETGGVTNEECFETSTSRIYVCESGPCNGSGWVLYSGSGTGDMQKSVYDTNSNNVVDDAENVTCTACVSASEVAADVATQAELDAHTSNTSNPHSVTGAQASFSDPDNKFAATNVEAAIAELNDVNASGPNATDGKVEWSQIVGMPSGFADGVDDTGGGGSGDITDVGTCATGSCLTDGAVQTNPIWVMEGTTDDLNETVWNITDPTADRTITIPDASGEMSLIGQTVESSEITDGTITAADLATDSVTAAEIAADAVGSSEIAAAAVGASEIATDAVGPDELNDGTSTPSNGFGVVVATGGSSFAYVDVATQSELDAHTGNTSNPHSVTGTQVSFSDPGNKFTATNVDAAIAELDDNNASGPNATDGKVSWTQLVDVPAGFADGVDDTASGGTGDNITVDGGTVDVADPDFVDSATIDFTGDTVPTPDTITAIVKANSIDQTQLAPTIDLTSDTFILPNSGQPSDPTTTGQVIWDSDGCLRIKPRATDAYGQIHICGDKLHYPQVYKAEDPNSDGLATAIQKANADTQPSAVVIPARDHAGIIVIDPASLTPDSDGCLFTIQHDVWIVGATQGGPGGSKIEIKALSPPGAPTYKSVFCLQGNRSGILNVTIRHEGTGAGTCSTTSTQKCLVDGDCPGTETCNNSSGAGTDATGTAFITVGRTGRCSHDTNITCVEDADCGGTNQCNNPSPIYPSNIRIKDVNFVGASYAGIKYTGQAIDWERGLKAEIVGNQASDVDVFVDILGHTKQKSNAISIVRNTVSDIRTAAIRVADGISNLLRIINNTFEPNTLAWENAANHRTIDIQNTTSNRAIFQILGNWLEPNDTTGFSPLQAAIRVGAGITILEGNTIHKDAWTNAIEAMAGLDATNSYVVGSGNYLRNATPISGSAGWHLDIVPYLAPDDLPPDFNAGDLILGDCDGASPPVGLRGDLCINLGDPEPRPLRICVPDAATPEECNTASEWQLVAVEGVKCALVESPASTDDLLFFRAERALNVLGIDCLVVGTTTPSVPVTVNECDANGANCVAVEAAITCGATNSTEAGAIDNPTIDAGDWLRLAFGAPSGTVDQVSVCVRYAE